MDLRVLGPVDITIDGLSVLPRSRRQRDLFALLALEHDQAIPTDVLVDRLWSGDPPASATAALQVFIAKLRKLLQQGGEGEAHIETRSGGYSLHLGTSSLDAEEFEARAQSGSAALTSHAYASALLHFDEALRWWKGWPYEDCRHLPTVELEARRIEELHTRVVCDRFDALLAAGRHAETIGPLEQLVAANPLRERHWEQLILAMYRDGRQADALRAYQRVRQILGEELGIEPGPRLKDLEERILFQDPGVLLRQSRALTNLEHPLTTFVGREDELSDVLSLVRTHRLVTLTGSAGCGKTRLATEAALQLVDEYPEGAWFVDLSQARDAAGVIWATGDALQIRAASDASLREELASHLEARTMLLVVDNCEQVLDSVGPLIEDLLQSAPGVTVLTTSRERLRIPGEVVWPVPSLCQPHAIPDEQCRGVTLFIERATAVDPGFVPEPAEILQTLCQRLDGLPLAIELAASRVGSIGVDELNRRLSRRFDVLGDETAPTHRQSTLERAIDWSLDLLTPDERRLWIRLAVFHHRFSLRDVEEVCAGDGLPRENVLPLLIRLVEKSLVTVHQGPRSWYSLLESLRERGLGLLHQAGEFDAVSQAHAEWFRFVAERAEEELSLADQSMWLSRLDADHQNLIAAFEWFMESGQFEDALRLGTGLRWYWKMHGPTDTGADLLERCLDLATDVDPQIRAKALMAAGALRYSTDIDAASQLLKASLTDAAPEAKGRAQVWLALIDRHRNSLDSSLTRLEEARALLENEGGRGLAFALGHLAVLAREQGRFDEAMALHKEALALDKQAGHIQDEAWNLAGLATVHLYSGDPGRAVPLLERSLEQHRQLGFAFETASVLLLLALSQVRIGETDAARAYLFEAMQFAEDLTSRRLMDAVLRGRSVLAHATGDFERAGEMLGAAERQKVEGQFQRGMFQRFFDEDLARLREVADPALLETAWATGRDAEPF